MVRTRYEILLARFRVMMTESGAVPLDITDGELLDSLKADTHEGRMQAMETLLNMTSERYWQRRGL